MESKKCRTRRESYPPSLSGWTMNINALKLLCTELFDKYEYEKFASHQLSQDDLELEFSVLKISMGPNKNPDPSMFMAHFQKQTLNQAGKPSVFANVTGEACQDLLANSEFQEILKNTEEEEEDEGEADTTIESPDIECLPGFKEFDSSQAASVQYVLGYCTRFLNCTICPDLFAGRDTDFMGLRMNTHIRNKDSSNSNLRYPTLDANDLGKAMTVLFTNQFRNVLKISPKNVRARLCEMIHYNEYRDLLCEECFGVMKDKFFMVLISGEIRRINNEVESQFRQLAVKERTKIEIKLFDP